MIMDISVIQKSWFRAIFPNFSVFNFATLIFFDCVCNYILAVFIYLNVYF